MSYSLENIIVANARYWLDYLGRKSPDSPLSDADLEGAAKALDVAATTPAAWPFIRPLTKLLHPYMKRRGPWTGWDAFLRYLLYYAQQRADQEVQLAFLAYLGDIQRQYGNHQTALDAYRQAWRLCRRSGDRFWQAITFSNLGDLYRLQDDSWRAEVLCSNAHDLFFMLGDLTRLAYTENSLGLINLYQRRWDAARTHFQHAVRSFEQVNDEYGRVMVWQNMSILYNYIHQPQEALAYLAQALRYYEKVEDQYYIALIHLNIGNTCLSHGDFERAEQASLQAETMFEQLADQPNLARTRHNLGMIYTHTAKWEEAERCFLWAVGHWQSRQDNWNLANSMGELAGMYITWGQREQAQHYLAAVAQRIDRRTDPAYQGLQRELAERREKLDALHAVESATSTPLSRMNDDQ